MVFNSSGLYLSIQNLLTVIAVVISFLYLFSIAVCLDMLDGYSLTANNVFSYIAMALSLCVYLMSISYILSIY